MNADSEMTEVCLTMGNAVTQVVKDIKEQDPEKPDNYVLGIAILQMFHEIDKKTRELNELSVDDDATDKIHEVVLKKVEKMPEVEVTKIYGTA